jgi:GntR family transcriptional regulator/MocR family aminotransferase
LKRATKSALLDFVPDRDSLRPMYLQLYAFVRLAIMNRSLTPGQRLPSTRTLAERLRISRNTVLTAFEELAAQGLIEGRIGAGTRVCGAGPMCVPKIPDVNALLREAHYPAAASRFSDPDGSSLYLHR